jgi:hypothetical protein
VCENEILGRKLGPLKEEVTGGYRKFHNEELDIVMIYRVAHISVY